MRWSRSVLVGIAVCGVVFSGLNLAIADDDDVPQRVTVSFGGGLNTAAPGNRLNHHVLPRVVKVRTKAARGTRSAVPGVVDFMVSGFHQISSSITLRLHWSKFRFAPLRNRLILPPPHLPICLSTAM